MFGETVIAREYGGKPVVCKVWEVTSRKIYVCTEETFEILKVHKGKPLPSNRFPVAFPREDIFRYHPKHKSILNNWNGDPRFWNVMVQYDA